MIERYVVEDQLGAGGVATVYRVRHTTLGSYHALKVLQLTGLAIRARLVEEGKVQANLKHPNIVTVTDVLDVDGSPGLIMEYIDGPSLDRWLLGNRPSPEQAEVLFRGILAGVARAHRVGLVHRDLKPGNVLLASAEEGIVPKVADFGLSKVLIEDQAGRAETRSGIAMGTPAYMAPEQVRDAKTVDQRADIFALGCILYELYLGVSPFDGPDVLTIFSKLASGSYTPPEELDATLPPRIRDAMVGCLQARREDRIADCSALRAVLDGGAYAPTGTSWTGRGASAGETPPGDVQEGASTTGHSGIRRSAAPTVALSRMAEPFGVGDGAGLGDGSGSAGGSAGVSAAGSVSGSAAGSASGSSVAAARPSGRGWGAILLAALLGGGLVLLLAGGGLFAFWYLRRPEGAPVVEVPAVSAPAVSAPAVASPPVASPPVAPPTVAPPTVAPPTVASPTVAPPPVASPTTAAPPAVAASPAVAPPPTASPTPASPPVVSSGTVTVTGDATEVWLVGPKGRVGTGKVSVGDYEVHAVFAGEAVSAGRVTVTAGRTVSLNCNADFQRCIAR